MEKRKFEICYQVDLQQLFEDTMQSYNWDDGVFVSYENIINELENNLELELQNQFNEILEKEFDIIAKKTLKNFYQSIDF